MTKAVMLSIGMFVVLGSAFTAERAEAQFFLEPEMGIRTWSGDAGDLLGTGLSFGGNLGYFLNPKFALVGHGDFAVHGAGSGEGADQIVDSGGSFTMLAGARFVPMGGKAEAKFQPYLGAGLGFGAIAWTYTDPAKFFFGEESDGLGGGMGMIEGGGDYVLDKTFSLGVSLRYHFVSWGDETSNNVPAGDFKGDSFQAVGRLMIRL
jgi:hypothetical protein